MLCCAFLVSGMAIAQEGIDNTFAFCDENGTVIPNGSTVTRNEIGESILGEPMIDSKLFVKYVADGQGYAGVVTKINGDAAKGEGMPSGTLQTCFPVTCVVIPNTDPETTTYPFVGEIPANGGGKNFVGDPYSKNDYVSIQSEWLIVEGKYGNFSVDYTIAVYEKSSPFAFTQVATGPTVTVNYVYSDPAGIDEVSGATSGERKVVARYNAAGQLVSAPVKGLNIVKTSDGKTTKYIIK